MAVIPARRCPETAKRSVLERLGGYQKTNITCKFWQKGMCTHNPCRFLHGELAAPQFKSSHLPRQSHLKFEDGLRFHKWNMTWKNSDSKGTVSTPAEGKKFRNTLAQSRETGVSASRNQDNRRTEDKRKVLVNSSEDIQKASKQRALKLEDSVNTNEDDEKEQQELVKREGSGCLGCVQGNGFSLLATLEGHSTTVSGIALPSGSNKLYSCGMDKALRVWDCNSGQCDGVLDFDMECGTMESEGPWVFVGMLNVIKAWNIQTKSELSFEGPVGKVTAIEVYSNMLFSGSEDGTILGWRTASETSSPELVASLNGHNGRVLSLIVGCTNRLFSASADQTIRVWDLDRLKCIHTLQGHTNDVTSLIVWDSYLFSGSLDNKIKVWAARDGKLDVVAEHTEDDGVIALRGMYDAKGEPVLLCSCKDYTVRLYHLPSFSPRGKIVSEGQVQSIQSGPGGLFFIGDATGKLSVWKFDETQQNHNQN